jgi:hypothetical protein
LNDPLNVGAPRISRSCFRWEDKHGSVLSGDNSGKHTEYIPYTRRHRKKVIKEKKRSLKKVIKRSLKSNER